MRRARPSWRDWLCWPRHWAVRRNFGHRRSCRSVLAAFLIVAPPRRSPGPAWIALFLALGALALTALSCPPDGSGFRQPWRQVLLTACSVELPDDPSRPQPWLSAEAACLLLAGLAFAWCVLAQRWDVEARRRALQGYASRRRGSRRLPPCCCTPLHHKPPWWPQTLNSPIDFGFFPSRNQTANVLALAGIISTALASDCFARKRRAGWFWVASVIVIGVALVIDYSRAGIALFRWRHCRLGFGFVCALAFPEMDGSGIGVESRCC